MNRTRVLRTVVVPTLIALLATLGLYTALSSRLTAPEKVPVVTGQVVVASTSIPSRTLITRDMVSLKDVPLAFIAPGTVRSIEACVGRVSLVPLANGEILLATNVTGPVAATAGLSYAIPPGKRALTVQVDEIIGIAGFPLVGDRVDVLWTSTAQGQDQRTRLLSEDVPLLAVVQSQSVGVESGEARDLRGYTSVTLEVTTEQAATIVLAEATGRLRLMLRPAVDAQSIGEFELRSTTLLQATRALSLAVDHRIGLDVRVLELDVSALSAIGCSPTERGLVVLSSAQFSHLNALLDSGRGRLLNRGSLSTANRVGLTFTWMGEAIPTGGGAADAYPAPYGLSMSLVPSYYDLGHVALETTARLQMVDVPADGRFLTGKSVSIGGLQRPQAGEAVLALGLVSADDLQQPSGGANRMVLPGSVSSDLLSGNRALVVLIVPSF